MRLAEGLRMRLVWYMVSITFTSPGILPVTVDMRSLPRSALGGESPPPPLPPKQFSDDDPIPLLECHEPPQDVPPPRPPKAEHNKPP